MTNDFKLKLLEYITGKLNIETDKKDNIVINNIPSVVNDFYTQLDNQFQYGFTQVGYVQAKDIDNNGTNFMVVYGSYYTNEEQTTTKGYIAILDNELNLLEIITKYSTGTDFGNFKILNVDETGKFYGIDEDNSKLRFLLLNNFTVKTQIQTNYTVVLRKSYYLSGESNNITDFKIMKKNPGGANYILAGNNNSSVITTTIKIEVGTQNEWIDYTYPKGAEVNDLYVNWKEEGDEEQVEFYISAYNSSTQELIILYHAYTDLGGVWSLLSETSATNYFQAMYIFGEYDETLDSPTIIGYHSTFIFLMGKLRIRFSSIELYHNKNTNKIEYKYKATFTTYVSEDSYPAEEFDELWSNISFLKTATNDIFMINMYNVNFPSTISNMIININATLYDRNDKKSYVDNYISLGQTTLRDLDSHFLMCVNKQFNLYSVKSLLHDFDSGLYYKYESRFSYNQNNYNGIPYDRIDLLVPQNAKLYSNNIVVFDRNMYNVIVSDNTTTGVLEVPNQFLNDKIIDKEIELGKTNYNLVESNINIETNIYETLFINFINTLKMSNENDLTNIIQNETGAIEVNKSISNTNDYSNIQAIKYRINYADGTNEKKLITNISIDETNFIATLYIYLYVDKEIENIDIISNATDLVYATISCDNLEVNKDYMLKQHIEIR